MILKYVDNIGNIHTPVCVSLAPANDNGENRISINCKI